MALSDEVLAHPGKLAAVRARLRALGSAVDARASFLVDEDGNPFATVGHLEFQLPHPLAGLLGRGGEPLLQALLGEPQPEESGFVVERVLDRALVVVVLERAARQEDRAIVSRHASAIRAILTTED
jgi:hypothetical protein